MLDAGQGLLTTAGMLSGTRGCVDGGDVDRRRRRRAGCRLLCHRLLPCMYNDEMPRS